MFNFWFDVTTSAAPMARIETFAPDPETDEVGVLRFKLPAGAVIGGQSTGVAAGQLR